MTIQEYLKEGNSFASLENKPIKEDNKTVFIHKNFFTQKALDGHKNMWADVPNDASFKYQERLYGGETPDAKWVDWIYTNTAIVNKETAYDIPDELDADKMFTYQGWHFIPAGSFEKYLKENDLKSISVKLKSEWNMILNDYKEDGVWSHKQFYLSADQMCGQCECDVFFCLETQKYHVPCEHELFILKT